MFYKIPCTVYTIFLETGEDCGYLLDIKPCNFYLNGMLKDKAIGSNGLHNKTA